MRGSFLACAGMALVAGAVRADTADVVASRDNTLYQDASGSLSNGQGPYMFSGTTSLGLLRRALVRFDVAGAVPAGSVITDVTLTLHMSRTNSGDMTVGLYRALKDWGEGASSTGTGEGGSGAPAAPGDATWLHTFSPNQFWGTPGGAPGGPSPDYGGTASTTATVGLVPGWYVWTATGALLADVQSFLNQPAANFGWFVIADENSGLTTKRYDTRESTAPEDRPLLHIVYTPPAPPCYPNCDHSTTVPVLNVLDFACFLNAFASGASYANCDNSTTAPVLNVLDFACFLNRFAAGCT